MPISWSPNARRELAPRKAEDAPLPKADLGWLPRNPEPKTADDFGVAIRQLAIEGKGARIVAIAAQVLGPLGALHAAIVANRDAETPLVWEETRTIALHADRPRAIALGEAEFDRASNGGRMLLAHVFFDRPEWAASIARSITENPGIDRTLVAPLLGSLADFDLLAPLLAKRQGIWPLLDPIETFGERALDVYLRLYDAPMYDAKEVAHAIAQFADARAAERLALEISKKTPRTIAMAYFARHPDLAEHALAPIAQGRSKAAVIAKEALASALRAKDQANVEEADADEVPEVLRIPPWEAKKRSRKPKISGLRYETLTRPKLPSGRVLPMDAFRNLLGILSLSSADDPHPSLFDAIAKLDSRTRAELAWELARHWEISKARVRDQWMVDSLVPLADEEVTRRTTPAIAHARIYRVLGCIATDAAAMELLTAIARLRVTTKSWTASEPEKAFELAATKRKMSKDELEDRVVPTLGVDGKGGVDLDYGSRTVRVVFDFHLEPRILSPTGATLRALPDKGKNDDPEKVAAAKRRFAELHEDVTALAARRVDALERAMIGGRTWALATWRRVWAEHVLMAHLARGVIWISGTRAFRLAEDGTFAGEDDAPIVLEGDAAIGVAHPIDLDIGRWKQVFADYEILQPFEQIDRPCVKSAPVEVPLPRPITSYDLWRALRTIGYDAEGLVGRNQTHGRPHRGDNAAVIRWTVGANKEVASIAVEGDVHPIEISEVVRDVKNVLVQKA